MCDPQSRGGNRSTTRQEWYFHMTVSHKRMRFHHCGNSAFIAVEIVFQLLLKSCFYCCKNRVFIAVETLCLGSRALLEPRVCLLAGHTNSAGGILSGPRRCQYEIREKRGRREGGERGEEKER